MRAQTEQVGAFHPFETWGTTTKMGAINRALKILRSFAPLDGRGRPSLHRQC